MKRKNKLYIAIALVCGLGFFSCDKFLDEMPDNRAKLDTEAKIDKVLVSAYPATAYLVSAEFSSDNIDDYGISNPYNERDLEQLFRWNDVTENTDDSPKEVWEACYKAISSANAALGAIEEMGNPASLNAQRGEALAARAYSHFILVNLFAQHYHKDHAATDLGITYMLETEDELNPQYERNTVQEVYDYMVRDLEEALPLIDDASYGETPKYHMNSRAANALAARIALYMQNWEKAISYATAAIGSNPSPLLRDNRTISASAVEVTPAAIAYNRSSIKANLMLATAGTSHGLYFGNYYTGARFAHGAFISNTETMLAEAPYGKRTATGYIPQVFVYSGTNLDKHLFPRVSYQFEYTDVVAGIGYRRGAYAPFTTEETMLVRAEALIHLKRYEEAVVDMKRWVDNTLANPPATFTVESLNEWADGLEYYEPDEPTPKKRLDLGMIPFETGTQENMLHALLYIRRIETMHMGLRWFDVKRYGIEVARRLITTGTTVSVVENDTKLVARDNRAALQIPLDVISAGLTPNPR
ncbi:RagB/SusD family nutrient uptake outer membrane protein [Sphingobacterium sp. SGR-19]|jgi:tetratricopeptide (TPR) repeat protein|uniref:RagB/SusD family nutrient uptake outer membrane protein n=1 Tax=Sphingobacterium sp. SGR-19 TaxID=2710886 RepID=UPI0013EC5B16|nr:RagB/SusD family nutrient uptake outer membrane protein [Sphingobacterium sp. SGR-19]NGM64600.1 RagB/SusD family nutrient uptake outer membrane protein [Sphingobacterium sp. SGR-19]